MPSLRDLQLRFAATLSGSASAGSNITLNDERLAAYRANARANYRNALAATYPVVKRLTGAPFFNTAVDEFVAAHPPVSGDLNVYGEHLAGFLQRYTPAATLPYLPDVARLEWAIDEANRAADVPRVPDAVLAALAMVAPERLPNARLVLNVSCRLVASAFPIMQIWRVNQPDRSGAERVDLDEGGILLLVRRDLDGVVLQSLSAGEHAFLSVLAQRSTFGAAIDAALSAESSFDLGAVLQAHIAAGTIAAVVDR